MVRDFCFVTDSHIGGGANVRTGDVYQDLYNKFNFIKDYCNQKGCRLLIGGDVFDKPTIADVYKTPFLKLFLQFDAKPLIVRGNHCTLFNSRDNDYKTTMQLFIEAGAFEELHTLDLGDLVITSELPLKTYGKPQILMYHGFLNKRDGWCSVMLSDLATEDETLALLGHDHVVYEPVTLGTVRVLRPGSLLRGIRNDESNRVPNLLHIRYNPSPKEGELHLKYKVVPISVARDPSEIFKTKQVTLNTAERYSSYEAIIEQISKCSNDELTLVDAVKTVSDYEVASYVEEMLNESLINNKNK